MYNLKVTIIFSEDIDLGIRNVVLFSLFYFFVTFVDGFSNVVCFGVERFRWC